MMREAMLANGLARDNAASFGRAVHGALSHHAHKARDAAPDAADTLRYLRCILAIKRAYLGEAREGEALMDAAQIAAAIDLPPGIERDHALQERDAARQERDDARQERDAARAALAASNSLLMEREAERRGLAMRLRDFTGMSRGAALVLRAGAAMSIAGGRLTGRRGMVQDGLRLRRVLSQRRRGG